MLIFKIILFSVVAFVIVGLALTLMILLTREKLIRKTPIKIFINEDESLTKKAKAGSTLLNTLLSNGISIPSPCGGKATCKQCKVQVLDGGGELLETDKSSFTKPQLKEGFRLSCQCKLRQDLKIKIPEELLEVKEFEGTVVSNENVATFIKELIVELPTEIEYRSGAYLQIHVPPFLTNTMDWKKTMEEKYFTDWEKYEMFGKKLDFLDIEDGLIRAYSMASYPAEKNILKFNIRIATPPFEKGKLSDKPWGIGSSYTFSLKQGDKIKFSGPYGESFMIDDDRDVIFLIGGAGSSFGRSHILHLFHTEKTKRNVSLWYGARSLKENIYEQEFKRLDQEFSNFSYHLVLSEPTKEDFSNSWPKEDPIKTNYLFKAFELGELSKMEEADEKLYYVCGPPMHNSSVMKLLDDYGVLRESIILDDFGS